MTPSIAQRLKQFADEQTAAFKALIDSLTDQYPGTPTNPPTDPKPSPGPLPGPIPPGKPPAGVNWVRRTIDWNKGSTTAANRIWVNELVVGDILVISIINIPAGFVSTNAGAIKVAASAEQLFRIGKFSLTEGDTTPGIWNGDTFAGPVIAPSIHVGGPVRQNFGRLVAGVPNYLNIRTAKMNGELSAPLGSPAPVFIEFHRPT